MHAVAIPPFERFYEEHRVEVLRLLRRRLGARSRRRRVPGDVPAGAQGVRPPRPRRAPAGLGADDRAERRARRASPHDARRPSSSRIGAEDSRPAYEELAELTDGLPPEGARRRRAPLRLRPLLRPDRLGARLEPGRGPTGHVHGRPPAAKEDRLMTVSHRSRSPLPRGRVDARPRRRRLRRRRLADRRAARRRVRHAASRRSRSTRDPDEELERLARIAGPRVLRSPRSVDAARRELDEYFAGRRRVFDLRARPPRACRRSRSRSSTSSPASRTARRRPTARWRRGSAAARRTRGRHGHEPQPDPDRPPVPPRRRRERRPRRLRGRARPQGHAPRARRRAVALGLASAARGGAAVTRASGTPRPTR